MVSFCNSYAFIPFVSMIDVFFMANLLSHPGLPGAGTADVGTSGAGLDASSGAVFFWCLPHGDGLFPVGSYRLINCKCFRLILDCSRTDFDSNMNVSHLILFFKFKFLQKRKDDNM